ncbi:MAG: hypothetical protein ACK4GL_00085 [Flavobacteriales bacterium]
MKLLITLLILASVFFAACQTSTENQLTDTNIKDTVLSSIPAVAATVSFRAGYGDYDFTVKGTLLGDSSEIFVQHKGTDYNGSDFGLKLPGKLSGALCADVNENFKPELYIWTRTPKYKNGHLIGFEFASKKTDIQLPELPAKYAEGYNGRDTFYIKQDHLIRSFPVYEIGAGAAVETGKIRSLWYSLNTEGKLILIN